MSGHDDDSITPERFALVRRTFEAALDRPCDERSAFLEVACRGDRQLLEEVRSMLAYDERASSPLDRRPSSATFEPDRLPSGSVMGDRYRIVGYLGRGGMGEVYHAHDMILNQAVALKFLASAHASDAALRRFRNEVRVARHVSHPNVCRVYDVGTIDGRHFLSMEYIDGEDLSSLLRRVGRLPEKQAIELTRKICAGLHAAHDRGVLHRDLKPANIMIDGRGLPHITDFGLAALTEDSSSSDLRGGTPAYMSPEQKAGVAVGLRSDLYSLGLVLREMFTGVAPQGSSCGVSPSATDLDPAIERIILHCLEQDPRRRPPSALAVAIALPGGDPIAAALAAGETPSPEEVAASERMEGLSTRMAALCLVCVVVATVLAAMFSYNSRLLRIAPLDISAQRLASRAAEILRDFGYSGTPVASAYGFECCDAVSLLEANRLSAAQRDARLASHQPPVVAFWYRQHQNLLFEDFGQRHVGSTLYSVGVGYDQPANDEAGMVRLKLDATGRLVSLEARPAFGALPLDIRGEHAAWTPLFHAAGLDVARFTPSAPRRLPPMAFDARAAWTGSYATGRSERVQVEAASWEGRPVYFSVVTRDDVVADAGIRPPAITAFILTLIALTCVTGGFVAFRNLRSGRGDRKGAASIALAAAASMIGGWIFGTTHVAHGWELALIIGGFGRAAVLAGLLWVAYLAVEPFMRRHWPESLISWNRLRSGRLRDPLVASHVLVGITAWMAMGAVTIPLWHLRPVWPPETLRPLDSVAHLAAFLSQVPAKTISVALSFLVIVVVLRFVTRRRMWIADVLACVVFAFTGPLDVSDWSAFVLSASITVPSIYVTIPWLIRRFGLLAILSAWAVRFLLAPLVPGSWYATRGLFIACIPVAIGAWAVWVIISSRRDPAAASSA